MSEEGEKHSNTGRTRRHFLGLAAAAGSRVAAVAAAVSAAVPPSIGHAWGRDPFGLIGGGGNKGHQCFLRGTSIMTPSGKVGIETLRIGDVVLSAEGEALPVRWIGRRVYKRLGTTWQKGVTPVRISAHALGHNIPSADLYVSAGHALFLDGVLIQARDLINGRSVRFAVPEDTDTLEYLHVMLDTHEAIIAEGAPVETLLMEAGVHENYSNFAEFAHLYPQGLGRTMQPFAPTVGYGGRLHLKALIRSVVGRFMPVREPAERIYERVAARMP